MKKIFLTLAGSALISLAAVNAQQTDTTGTGTRTREQSTSGSQQGSDQYRSNQGTSKDKTQGTQPSQSYRGTAAPQWRVEDREELGREKLPATLLQTLNSDRYKGWENATIYRNKQTDEYMLIMSDGSEPRTFFFDKTGNAVNYNQPGSQSGSGTSGQGNDDGTSGSSMSGSTSGTSGTTSGSSTTGSDYSQGSQSSGSTGAGTTGTTSSQTQGTSSSQNTTGTGSTATTSSSTVGTGTQGQPSTQWRTEDRVMVTTSQIPSSLRTTLKSPQYKGWENSTVYRNSATNEYMVEIRNGSSSKTYYFDKDGKAIHDANHRSNNGDQ
jgi:hypothetical protein